MEPKCIIKLPDFSSVFIPIKEGAKGRNRMEILEL